MSKAIQLISGAGGHITLGLNQKQVTKLKEDNSGRGCLFYKGLPNEGTKWGTMTNSAGNWG